MSPEQQQHQGSTNNVVAPRSTDMDWELYLLFENSDETLIPETISRFREPEATIPAEVPGKDDICGLF